MKARARLSVLAAVIVAVPLTLAASARASAPEPFLVANADCTLAVPASPLSAQGLATPYRLSSAGTTCAETDPATAAFVQATILDPATGKVSVYDPLVVTAGTVAAVKPAVPALPANAIVALWTGFNGNVLKLTGTGADGFVNFSQQAFDNSAVFFAALGEAGVKAPPLGTASDGKACPSSRDFSIVDQDQSDNVPVTYLLSASGQSAQDTRANQAAVGTTSISNGSDEQLLDNVDAALGCTPWQAASLTDPGTMEDSGMLQEYQAAQDQAAPVALVPSEDEFVTANGQFNGPADLYLQNLYREQVDQLPNLAGNDTPAYCGNLASAGEPRLAGDAATEAGFPAPSFAPIGTNLANVLAARFEATWANLGCSGPSPITVTTDANGIATSATYNGTPGPTPTPTPTMTGTAGTVAYDVTGPDTFGSQVSTISWTHMVSAGANRALLVSASMGADADDGCVMSATDNGTALPALAKADSGNKGNGFGQVYGEASPPVGANHITVTVADCTYAAELLQANGFIVEDLTGGSESFAGVSQSAPFGTPATNVGGTSGTSSVSLASSQSGDLVAGFAYAGSAISALSSGGTSRYVDNEDAQTAAGNQAGATAPGGSPVTFTWSQSPDIWAAIAVEVNHA